MDSPLYVVTNCIDRETVETLERLLTEAKSGHLVGLAYVALHRRNEYAADIIGAAKETPLLARGLCRALEDAVVTRRSRR